MTWLSRQSARSNYERIYFSLLPPFAFLRGVVKVVVMCGAERNREFVTDFKA